jgi:hypothetical protein
MDGARCNYRHAHDGVECCEAMQGYLESGVFFDDLTTAASKLSGESLPHVRFCPWCGWDNDKTWGLSKHRKAFAEALEAERIGATL